MKIYSSVKYLLTAFLTVLTAFQLQAQSREYIDALKNYQQGNMADAQQLFRSELDIRPDNDAACYYLATILATDASTVDEAEVFMKKAVELAPDNFWYKYSLAVLYSDTDRKELTIQLLEDLLDEYPKKNNLYFDLLNIYMSEQEIDKALVTLDRIDQIRGKSEPVALTRLDLQMKKPGANVDSVYALLIAYYEECRTPRLASVIGDYYSGSYRDSLAMTYYDQALAMDEDFTPAHFGKAGIYQVRRQYGNFFNSFMKVVEDPSVSPEAKCDYFRQLTEPEQFARTFQPELDSVIATMLEVHPADSTINTVAGAYYYNSGRPFDAERILRLNMASFPDSPAQTLQYLVLLYYMQAWEGLVNASASSLQRFPGNADFLQLRSIANQQLENYDEAISDLLAILAGKPSDPKVVKITYSSIGDLYSLTENWKKAYQYYEKVLKMDPEYNPVLNNYAYHLSLEGKNLKKARQMSKKTIESEPDNPTYLDTYAWILHLMGDDIEAKAIFKHAMLYGGKEERTIMEHYAEVLEALGEKDLAKIYRKQAEVLSK